MMQFVLIAEQLARSLSNQRKEDQYIVENVIKSTGNSNPSSLLV